MTHNITKEPVIRFNGYTDAWEQRKLEDIANYIRGSFPQPYTNPDFYDEVNGMPFVQVADIGFDLKLNSDTKAHISKIAEPKSRFVEAGKVVVALQGSIEKSIGRTAITQYDAFFDRTILIFEDYKIDMDKMYFAQVIKSLFEKEKEKAWGATISTITKSHLNDFVIGVPDFVEQSKIGNFFKQLDETITLQERELELLKEQKQGFLQKMFPKQNENVPEFRFEGFTDAWEQRKLGDLVVDHIEKTTIQNQYPVLTSSQKHGIVLQEDYFSNRQVTTDNNIGYFILPRGYYTYRSRSDNSIFIFNRNDIIDRGIISYFYPVFSLRNTDSEFFLRRINNGLQKQVTIAAEGTGQHVLSLKKFKNITTKFPIIEEQTQIGNFFKQLDKTIAFQERKLETLKDIKKSFLQKMFV